MCSKSDKTTHKTVVVSLVKVTDTKQLTTVEMSADKDGVAILNPNQAMTSQLQHLGPGF